LLFLGKRLALLVKVADADKQQHKTTRTLPEQQQIQISAKFAFNVPT
jgi:hypothetical protein